MYIQSILQSANIYHLRQDNPSLIAIHKELKHHDAVQYTSTFKLPIPPTTAVQADINNLVSLPRKLQIVLPFPLPICNGSIVTDVQSWVRDKDCNTDKNCIRVFVDLNQHHRVEVTKGTESSNLQVPIFLMNPKHLNLVIVPQIDKQLSCTKDAQLIVQFQTYALSQRLYSMMSNQTVENSYNMMFFHNSAMNGSKL